MDNYIGEIKAFPYNFVPEGWFACNGQQVAITQYQALFAVIGHNYDPSNNPNPQQIFYLPDLRGVVPMGAAGTTSSVAVGQTGGAESVTLNLNQIPKHNHNIQAEIFNHKGNPSQLTPQPSSTVYLTNTNYTQPPTSPTKFLSVFTYAKSLGLQPAFLSPTALSSIGGTEAHENRMPFLPLQFGICYEGTFPPHQ